MSGKSRVRYSAFDAAHHLDNPDVIAAYLGEAFETGDNAFIARAIETAVRARARLNTGDEFDGPQLENTNVPWARANRLRPMRMVWSEQNHNEPKCSLPCWRKPGLRKVPRLEWIGGPKVADDRETRRRFPGRTGGMAAPNRLVGHSSSISRRQLVRLLANTADRLPGAFSTSPSQRQVFDFARGDDQN